MRYMKLTSLVATLALAIIPAKSRAADCAETCHLQMVQEYFTCLDAVYREGSTLEDIEALFGLFDENVVYEHIAYDARFDKASWKEAFTRNLNNGSYNKSENERIGILKSIHGGSHLAVEYAYGRTDDTGNWSQKSDGLLILFGFHNDKIVLVREYWE